MTHLTEQRNTRPWLAVCTWPELENKGRVLLRHDKYQVVVFLSNKQIYAIDNRCPHEGYPLIQGEINPENCTLTCQWHNWKFDLKSGAAKVGQDSVRTYPTKIEEGMVWVDLSPPSKVELSKKLLKSLNEAFEKRQYGRLARELARFHYHRLDPLEVIKEAIVWSYDRLEYGMGHAYAVTADWLDLYFNAQTIDDQLIALTEALDHMALDSLRQPTFTYSEGTLAYQASDFLAAIESEDQVKAIQLLRGALSIGLTFSDLEASLATAALAHYNDFGHSLIYVLKVNELIQQLGPEITEPLLLSLVRSLVYATREDLLPEFKAYASLLSELKQKIARDGFGLELIRPDFAGLQGASVKQAMQWVVQQRAKYKPEAIYQTLLHANAHNLLHYDLRFQVSTDNPVADNVGWLDYTHALTFANAVRVTCEKYPDFWPQGLLQLAAFYGRNTGYLDLNQDVSGWFVADETIFWVDVQSQILDHGLGLPIFSAHVLKTARAVNDEASLLTVSDKNLLLAALQRFLNEPLKQKHIRRVMHQSLQLVGRDF